MADWIDRMYIQILLIAILNIYSPADVYAQIKKTSNLGSRQVLDCDLHFPNNKPVKYILEWKKGSIHDSSVYLRYENYGPIIHPNYQGRVELEGISLVINHVRASDQGWYECKVVYLDGTVNNTEKLTNGTWVYLTVNTPPNIYSSSPSTLPALQGATVKLFCKATGSPKPNILWNKDGAPLSPGPRLSMSEDRTEVTINAVQRSDGGIYSCTFINPVGQVMQRIDLIVEGISGAYVLNPPINMTAVEGQLVTFHCEADANPNNITYRWYFENRQIDMNIIAFKSRFSVNQQGSLSINNVQKRDMGWYICRPSNGVGQDPEAAAYLNVTYPPKVIKDLIHKRLIWALGFQEQLDCPVDANPPVTEIIWTKDNFLVEFSSNRRTQLSNGSLLVKRVEQIDAGQYSCIPLSTAGRGDTSPIVQIVVRDPPRFVLRPQEHYIRKPGEEVTMICSAAGTPEPVVTWRRVGGTIIAGGRINLRNGNLTIRQLQKSDHGEYECEARNDVKRIIANTALIIQMTTPHAPYNLTAIPSWFSVQIRWLPAYNGGSPQHYVVWYRSIITGEVSQWQTLQVPDVTSYTVHMLEADTLYEFKLLARNKFGNGTFSNTIRVKTLGEEAGIPTALPTDSSGATYYPPVIKPIGERPFPPRNVTAALKDGGILISWLPPNAKPGLSVKYYVIDVKTDEDWKSLKDTEQTSYLLENPNPATTYRFRVFAYSIAAYSYPSTVAMVTTPEEGKDFAPRESDEKPKSGFFLSDPQIGGIIGGLLFLLVAVLLAIIGVMCSKRRDRNRGEKYGNVKYIGPADEMDNSHNRTENEAEWNYGNTSGGRNSLRPIRLDNGIFIVPQTNEIYREEVTPQSTSLRSPRFYDPDNDMFDSNNSYKAPSSGKRVNNGSHPVESFSHWPQSRNESYIDRPYFADSTMDRDQRQQNYRSPNSSRYSERKLPQVPTVQSNAETAPSNYDPYPILKTPGSLQNGSSDDDEGGFVPRRPPLPDGYKEPYDQGHKRPYEPQRFVDVPQSRGDDPTYQNFPFYPDDVFSTSVPQYPSSERPTFPRHSSMKPTSYQTYLTGDPIQNETLPFTDEISSVLPSFTEKPHDHSSDSHSYKYPYSGPEDSYKYPYSGPEDSYKYPYSGPEDSYTPQRMERPNWTLSNDRYNDSNDRSFSPGRWAENSPVRDKQVARVSPTKKLKQNGSDSSEPLSYTRDQLQGAVERVRRAPRLRRPRSTGRPFYSEQDSFDSLSPQVVPSGYRGPNLSESDILPRNSQFRKGPHYSDSDAIPSAHDYDRYGRPYGYKYDIEPFKGVGDSRNSVSSSGRGSMPSKPRPLSDPRGYSRDNATPDSISSGIGSRNTSQVTGSSMNSRIPGHYPSVSSVLTPQEHDLSHDSSPFLDGTSSLPRRDISADENYEFDSTLLDNDLTDPVRSYPSSRNNSQLRSALESGLNTSDFYNDLYPKPSKESRYSDSEARFEKLRQEYHQFRRKQNERYHQSRLLAMDSEML